MIPESAAREHLMLAVRVEGQTMIVAAANPDSSRMRECLDRNLALPYRLVLVGKMQLQKALLLGNCSLAHQLIAWILREKYETRAPVFRWELPNNLQSDRGGPWWRPVQAAPNDEWGRKQPLHSPCDP